MSISPQANNSLDWAHPLVREWFLDKFGSATEPQVLGWPSILAGKTTLISAPTGSGKTFAAFLACIDRLVRQALASCLPDQTEVIYVSPLKALGNDIHKNLTGPLQEIIDLALKSGLKMAEIRVAVRTGDTLAKERQAMLKKPPHILVTTPESLYILLTAEKSRAMLAAAHTVIVDEIHALANDKRGAHLTLSLERLQALTGPGLVRIGLSATQKPLETVGRFLAGGSRPTPTIINIGHARHLDLAIETPRSELGAVASNEMWDEIYERLAELSGQHRSTLVFVNTRRLAERVAHHLAERLGEYKVAAHHGSLSRKLRLNAETRLKQGELKVLVATASLELGIDIGSIDLVCQIGSPRAIAAALQRIGRAGHWRGAISKGRIFASTRDELLECAALVHAIREGDLDQLIIPREPLDILAQQIVAACAAGEWREEELFALVKNAYPYADLTRETFDSILLMLSEGIAGSRGRYGAYLFRDQINGMVRARRGARLAAITSGGAIPDNGLFTVIAEPQGNMVGTLDEDFAVESNRGDIILLGTTSWQIRRIESAAGRVLVEDAHGAPPSVPFWRGEAPARTVELSLQVSRLREKISDLLPGEIDNSSGVPAKQRGNSFDCSYAAPTLMSAGTTANWSLRGALSAAKQSINDAGIASAPSVPHNDQRVAIDWLKNHCGVDNAGAEQLLEYVRQGRAVLGAVPSQRTVIAERFFDESGGMQLIIHAPFGARINKAWGLALRKRFCRSFNFELQAAATDDGLNIALAEQHSFPLADVFQFLHPNTIKDVLTQAILPSPLFKTRWRWDASRALALQRFRNGKKIPPNIQRMLSDDLLAAVFPDAAACQDNLGGRDVELPDHPLINETMKDALTEALDLDGLINVLHGIINGEIKCLAVDTPLPSPFSHEILNANPYAFLDDAPLEERRARAVEMRRILPESMLQEVGRLDPAAIIEVQRQAWPDIRHADELHDMLQTLITFPENFYLSDHQKVLPEWHEYFHQLLESGRAGIAVSKGLRYWVAAEKSHLFAALYPDAILAQFNQRHLEQAEHDESLVHAMRGWMQHAGPVTANEINGALALDLREVEQTLLRLETTGLILRGHFRTIDGEEWCERRLLARIHKLTIGKLRREIAPVSAAEFIRWLLRWQHVAPGTQLSGEQGLLEVIRQLQGYEIPANAWEKQVLAKRVSDYDPDVLDKLCLSGTIGWGRLSPHPATLPDSIETGLISKKRVMPTSVAPVTFFVREEADWVSCHHRFTDESSLQKISHAGKKIHAYLKQRGASFFTDIVKGSGLLKSQVENGLWELVAAGAISADGFDNLRALIDPKRRLDRRRRVSMHTGLNTGRWSLLHTGDKDDASGQIEAVCWMLLKRYGVVFRDLLVREKSLPRWREILLTLRRLEDRGEIRGGRFVSGFNGEQFALPYALESLRAIKNQAQANEIVTLSAVDPLNLSGVILPGKRIAALSGNQVQFQDGIPAAPYSN